jgi:hypothetical protein
MVPWEFTPEPFNFSRRLAGYGLSRKYLQRRWITSFDPAAAFNLMKFDGVLNDPPKDIFSPAYIQFFTGA